MEIIENTPERVVLKMNDNLSLANAIRRSLSTVPVLAIEEVEMFKNDSALYDEVLAHRLGLLPLKTDKSMNSKTRIELKLSAKGPGMVYAKDIEGDVEHIQPNMPIVLLGDKNHRLELTALASLGTGETHAKYLPGLCYYRHLVEVKSSPKIDEIIQSEKRVIFKSEKKGQKWICDLPESTLDRISQIESNAVSDSSDILFIVESWGQMPAKDILVQAVKSLSDNLDKFEENLN